MKTTTCPTQSGLPGPSRPKESTAGSVDLAWAFSALPSIIDCRSLRAALENLGIGCRGLDDAQVCSDAERLVNLLVMGYLESQSLWPPKTTAPSVPIYSSFSGLGQKDGGRERLRTQEQDLETSPSPIPTPETVDTNFSPSSFGSAFAQICETHCSCCGQVLAK